MFRNASVVLLAVVAAVAIPAARQESTFRADTHTVPVYATVVDRGGRLVQNLTKDDFEIFDNGVRQDITLFASDVQPITIVVMLDRSGSMSQNFGLVQKAAETFVHQLQPDDRARIGSFSTRIQIDPKTFTSDRRELLRILDEELQDAGPTPLWNATSAAMNALAGEHGRRVVLAFTDGRDTPGWAGENATFAEVRQRARTEEIMIYAIGLSETCATRPPEFATPRYQTRGPSRRPGTRMPTPGQGPRGPVLPPSGIPGRGPFGRPGDGWPGTGRLPRTLPICYEAGPDPDLRELAEDSGGGYFELDSTDHLGATFSRVADELHRQYLLGFAAPKADGALHALELRVKHADLSVRARRNYMAPSGQGATR